MFPSDLLFKIVKNWTKCPSSVPYLNWSWRCTLPRQSDHFDKIEIGIVSRMDSFQEEGDVTNFIYFERCPKASTTWLSFTNGVYKSCTLVSACAPRSPNLKSFHQRDLLVKIYILVNCFMLVYRVLGQREPLWRRLVQGGNNNIPLHILKFELWLRLGSIRRCHKLLLKFYLIRYKKIHVKKYVVTLYCVYCYNNLLD